MDVSVSKKPTGTMKTFLQVYFSTAAHTFNHARRHSSGYEVQLPNPTEKTDVWRRLVIC